MKAQDFLVYCFEVIVGAGCTFTQVIYVLLCCFPESAGRFEQNGTDLSVHCVTFVAVRAGQFLDKKLLVTEKERAFVTQMLLGYVTRSENE